MLQWIQGFKYLFELVFLLISEKSSRVKFLHLMEVLSLIFWELSLLFSTEVTPIYIPTNSAQSFPFIHTPETLVICCLSDNSHSKKSKAVSHSGFFQFASSWASFPWRRHWHPTPGLLPGKSHGQRVGCSRLQSMGWLRVGHNWATSLSLFTFMHWRRKWQPVQCSLLENPRDGGAWWASVYGVAQSPKRLKRLSSSSSIFHVSVGRLYVFLKKVSIQVLRHIFPLVKFFDTELYQFFAYFVYSLLNIPFANVFSHLAGCFYVLLIISFAVQRFLDCYSLHCLFLHFSLTWGDIRRKYCSG